MVEEHRGPQQHAVRENATSERSFDDLVKAFAGGTVSRRRLLGVMGKALVGSVLVSIPGVASTASGALAEICDYDVCLERGDGRTCKDETYPSKEWCYQTGRCEKSAPDAQCYADASFHEWKCCWRDSNACLAYGKRCCTQYTGRCTGTKIFFWQPAPTRCVTSPTGHTKCCNAWNQYPWITECDNYADNAGGQSYLSREERCGACLW